MPASACPRILVLAAGAAARRSPTAQLDAGRTGAIEPEVIAWRRDFHQNPELSNREVRTAKIVAEHLKKLGLEVETGIAHTGVVAMLKAASRARRSRCAPTWTRCR